MAEEIIARRDALVQGLKHYFTGKPCKNGHISKRWTVRRTCIGCINDFHARWYEANKEAKQAKNREFAAENPQNARDRALRWRNRNLEKARRYASQWYSDAENNRAHHHKRRSRIISAEGGHNASDLKQILKQQNYLCVYCFVDLRSNKRHVDHIQPLARGGSNDKSNLQYLCAPCNLSKGAKSQEEFLRFRLHE